MRRVVLFALFVVMAPTLFTTGAPATPSADDLERIDTEVEVFMEVGATRGQIARVDDAIRSDPEVRRYAYLDHQDALAEFRRIFRRNRELRRGVTARDLPVSFRLDVRAGHRDSVASRYATMPGVDATMDGRSNASNGWSTRLACSRTAYDLEVVMDPDASPGQAEAVAKAARGTKNVDGVEVADRGEVRRILACVESQGTSPFAGPVPAAIVHVDVADPADPAAGLLQSSVGGLPGVQGVSANPDVAASS